MNAAHRVKHVFFWLSGAGAESLEQTPNWEQRKYVAYGATVLVPTVFAFIAAAYALSTISHDWRIIIPVALTWSFIILTIDRALLATYRSYQGLHRKLSQFFLRFMVAMLMGLTISHPLTLLLFKDTIHSVVEQERQQEITDVRAVSAGSKKEVEGRIDLVKADIQAHRTEWDATFNAQFLAEDPNAAATDPSSELDEQTRLEMEARIAQETTPYRTKLATLEEELNKSNGEYQVVQTDLDHWQREFEREVNGQRSGIIGLGPRARSIQDDQLSWRREEAKRLSGVVEFLTTQQNALRDSLAQTEEGIKAEFATIAVARAAQMKEERERVVGLKRQVQQQQADTFVDQQNTLRGTIAAQIDTRLGDLTRLQEELVHLDEDEQERVTAIREEPRRDLLTQTLALHHLFERGEEGGKFAFIAYMVLAGLFMLVDTIPIIVKFFSKPGPYDTLVDCEEVRFDRERKAFLKSYDRYMNELSDGKFLHLTKNKPLERALIEGVDRSRVAKEFLEHLLELEQVFEQRMALERERQASAEGKTPAERVAAIEAVSQKFYEDMRRRMESFFEADAERPAALG